MHPYYDFSNPLNPTFQPDFRLLESRDRDSLDVAISSAAYRVATRVSRLFSRKNG